ncbi:hypothetical protein ILUMI_24287 [Ignelater luminosus]|uniref:Uncharacterized protein n=1 Tax=Ignelater luminosus TaxID=2038154 RepID=A0A8K0CAU5_IGNLU|nr:hypothetical protein ILUMI_24287 [Ignelater luminosus]
MSYEAEQKRLLQFMDEVKEEQFSDIDYVFEQSDNDELHDIRLATRFLSYIDRDGLTHWQKLPPRVKTPEHNVVTAKPGVIREAENIKNIFDCWQLYFTDQMILDIVDNTNVFILSQKDNYSRQRDAATTFTKVKA